MDRLGAGGGNQPPHFRGRPVSGLEAAHASEYFEPFLNATTLKNILGYHRSMCEFLHLKPNVFTHFYPKLRANLTSWRAKALWKRFDARAAHKCYGKGKFCTGTKVLVIGAGPCGLRTAIELQLLGAKVVVIEKRDRLSRNNVLHLWPFVIEDLRMLGAKKFFGKFCAGSIDHISIRQLQCILLKIALLLGVEVHTEVSFEKLVEPNATEKTGWRAEFKPENHPVSQYEFDVIIGADGKRNTLQGFKRKEFRGKLAIAITANFINKKTEAEARVEEISGVAFIFNQKFFKDLYEVTRIDLENIVYYKDDTHYFVMTAKKSSLLEKGVIKQDLADTEKLLAPDNVDRDALQNYAREAADFSTNYQMPDLEFAVNHYGQPDVAMFDFTSMYAAEYASKVLERNGHRLLMILVGDSLLEPFWPTGSGCARGFLSSLDAAWAIRSWSMGTITPLDVLAERESIYRLLAQTTPDNLNKDWKSYTLDPATRYPNLNKTVVLPHQTVCLYDTDNPQNIDKMKRSSLDARSELPKKRRRGNVDRDILLNWLTEQLRELEGVGVTDLESVFKDGKVLCALIHHYRPDLLDYGALKDSEPAQRNQLAMDILEKDLGIPPIMTGEEITNTEDYLALASYLTQVYDTFRGEIPHIKHPKLRRRRKFPVSVFPDPDPRPSLRKDYSQEIVPSKTKSGRIDFLDVTYAENCGDYHKNAQSQDCRKISIKHLKRKIILHKKKRLVKATSPLAVISQTVNQPKPKESGLCAEVNNQPPEYADKFELLDRTHKDDGSRHIFEAGIAPATAVCSRDASVKISLVEKSSDQDVKFSSVEFKSSLNVVKITPRICGGFSSGKRIRQIYMNDKSFLRNDSSNGSATMGSSKLRATNLRSSVHRLRYAAQRRSVNNSRPAIKWQLIKCPGVSVKKSKKVCGKRIADTKIHWNMASVDESSMYCRVSDWISQHDFKGADAKNDVEIDTVLMCDLGTDLTSVTRRVNRKGEYDDIKIEERTDVVKCENPVASDDSISSLARNVIKRQIPVRQTSEFARNVLAPTSFSVIVENTESELPPESHKRSDFSFKSIRTYQPSLPTVAPVTSRPSSRHKRHADVMTTKVGSLEKKQRKRRTLERVGPSIVERQKVLEEIASNRADRQSKRKQQRRRQTEQFLKSMQMLQANAKPDHSQPFEDYSIFLYRQTAPKFEDRVKDLEKQFTYVPDHENRVTGLKPQTNTNADEDIASKIRSLEDKWTNPQPTEKKPKDLLRAIGKIETSDWNIKEIEKKILENKIGKPSSANKDKERVPKWSREEFRARQTKMEKKHLDRQDSNEAKYADIDKNIKQLDLKLKEGTTRELGQNKVASITQKLVSRVPVDETKPAVEKPSPKAPFNLPPQKASEFCHFCSKRVYLMERLSAEGRFFHHGCFKCQYCHTQLRLGSYTFDRDGQYGHRFFCIHHYGMQGELPQPIRVARKPSQRGLPEEKRANDKQLSGVSGVDLLDRVKTPERIEFSNLSTGNISSDHEEPLSQMDEDEWTDKNFGASCAELDDSDDSSSSLSDTDSDDEDAYDDALEEPATKEGTMKWAERLKNSYRKGRGSYSDGYSSSDHSSYYENTSDDSDSETATEGEEEIRARELRKKEVCVDPPVPQTDTGTDTEIVTDESSSDSSSEIRNSATEISTDSEFAQDDPTPTREIPSIVFNDFYVTKTRGSGARNYPKKIQVTSGYLQRPTKEKSKPNIELKLTPLVPSTSVFKKPALLPRTEGYALNRTQSTGGIAAKVSLELKKKYLLGENGAGSIQKSGSASTLDTKFKSFQTTISDCQKLLKPATEVSASMQMFCSKLDERHSPLASPQSSVFFANKKEESLPPPDITITTTVEKTDREEHSSDSLSVSSSDNEEAKAPFQFDNIPRVEVHHADHKEETLLDSLSEVVRKEEPSQEHGKSVGSDKKSLNGPKSLPDLEGALPEIHQALHVKKSDKEDSPEENRSLKNASGKSSPTALTETELSDWARDGNVSDDMEFDFSHGIGKNKLQETTKPGGVTSTGVLDANLDSIEFMDYGTETSSDDAVVDSQNGYVLFKDEDELAEDSLAPNVCEILEAKNVYLTQMTDQRYGGEVIDLKPTDLEKMKRQPRTEPEDDSLLIIETGNTTEENTCSDSTVKNLTEISANKDKPQPLKLENFQKQRLEEKLAMVKAEQALLKEQKMKENLEFNEHCQRLQSKIEFGNARDSIDIRKSRRKSRTELPSIAAVKPDLIQEEENRPVPSKEITLDLKSAVQTPDLLYKKENIKKERDDNQRLIQEMVMNKMKAENKSLERKKRNRLGVNNMSPSRSQEQKTDIVSQINRSNLEKSLKSTPDLLSNSIPLQNSQTVNKTLNNTRPLSVFSTFTDVKRVQDMSVEKGSLPDIRKNLFAEAPKAPPRYNRPSDPSRTAEKLKESAKARAKLLSNEDLGLSPEDKLNKLRDKFSRKNKDENVIPLIQESIESLVINTERRNSLLYAKDTLSKKRNGSFRRSKSRDEEGKAAEYTKADYDEYPTRTKSVSEFPKAVRCGEQKDGEKKICKSDPNLLDAAPQLRKKCKDRERRKSITKLIANIFTKKSPTGNGNKGLFARLSPKTKSVSKSCTELDMILREIASEDPQRRNSVSEKIAPKRESTPPPVPPLPSNYTVKGTDESSDAEPEWRRLDQSSCDTLDKSGILETSTSSLTGRKGGKHRRQSRQAQLKRHRMAQEIQRKLEETEVKTRELEQRGVLVEKALRGEGANECMKDESELLQEWFDLMKDRTELRRYEKELMIRAQELELEDRHARLQAELRERLEAGTSKTEQDTQTEQGIINEMLDIVAKRDSLIAVLEEDRVRYSTEDKDLEEQMLTKGLMLTPIAKTSDK